MLSPVVGRSEMRTRKVENEQVEESSDDRGGEPSGATAECLEERRAEVRESMSCRETETKYWPSSTHTPLSC